MIFVPPGAGSGEPCCGTAFGPFSSGGAPGLRWARQGNSVFGIGYWVCGMRATRAWRLPHPAYPRPNTRYPIPSSGASVSLAEAITRRESRPPKASRAGDLPHALLAQPSAATNASVSVLTSNRAFNRDFLSENKLRLKARLEVRRLHAHRADFHGEIFAPLGSGFPRPASRIAPKPGSGGIGGARERAREGARPPALHPFEARASSICAEHHVQSSELGPVRRERLRHPITPGIPASSRTATLKGWQSSFLRPGSLCGPQPQT